MGIGVYFLAVNLSKEGLIGTGILGPAPLFSIVVYKMYFAISNKIKIGTFINPEKSNILCIDDKSKMTKI